MCNRILISVIIPVYNCEKYIERTLKSLTNQTFNNFEVIVIDDGSTDDTFNVSKRFLECSKLSYKLIKQNNMGVSQARNKGIEEASGRFIYFLDGDDYINNETFNILYKEIEKNDSDMIFFPYNIVNDSSEIWNYYQKYKKIDKLIDKNSLLKLFLEDKIFICMGSAIYKNKIIKENNIKFNIESKNGEDQEFICKYIYNCNEITYKDYILFHYYRREGSITNSCSLNRMDVVKSFLDLYNYLKMKNCSDKILSILKNRKIPYEIYHNTLTIINQNKYIDNHTLELLLTENTIKILKEMKIKKIAIRDLKVYLLMKFYVNYTKQFIKFYKSFKGDKK